MNFDDSLFVLNAPSVSTARRSSRTRASVDRHTAALSLNGLDGVALFGCKGKSFDFDMRLFGTLVFSRTVFAWRATRLKLSLPRNRNLLQQSRGECLNNLSTDAGVTS